MNNAFRPRRVVSQFTDFGSKTVNHMHVMKTKEVSDGVGEPTTFIECREVDAKEYAKTLNLPSDDEYQLRDMLKAGQIPQEVPVSGLLDSQDPTDLRNQGVGDRIFDELSSQVKSQEPASEPASSVEPSNAE